jgi:hypothetical protein
MGKRLEYHSNGQKRLEYHKKDLNTTGPRGVRTSPEYFQNFCHLLYYFGVPRRFLGVPDPPGGPPRRLGEGPFGCALIGVVFT